jgi:hypothetical protein
VAAAQSDGISYRAVRRLTDHSLRLQDGIAIGALIVATLMLFAGFGRERFSYYHDLRWVVSGTALWVAWRFVAYFSESVWKASVFGIILSLSVAVIFRPIDELRMSRAQWHPFDSFAIVVFAVLAVLLGIITLYVNEPPTKVTEADPVAQAFNDKMQRSVAVTVGIATLIVIALGIKSFVDIQHQNAVARTFWQREVDQVQTATASVVSDDGSDNSEYVQLMRDGPRVQHFDVWRFVEYELVIVAFWIGLASLLCCDDDLSGHPLRKGRT